MKKSELKQIIMECLSEVKEVPAEDEVIHDLERGFRKCAKYYREEAKQYNDPDLSNISHRDAISMKNSLLDDAKDYDRLSKLAGSGKPLKSVIRAWEQLDTLPKEALYDYISKNTRWALGFFD